MGDGYAQGPVRSLVGGSDVVSNRTVELVKQGKIFTLQTVIEGLTVGDTKDILLDPTAFVGEFLVIYEIYYKISQGKAIAQFFAGGTYAAGIPLSLVNRNENSSNTAVTVVSENPTVTVLGTGSYKYLAGGEAQGINLAGGLGGSNPNFPTEVKVLIPRLLRIIQSGGTGTFDLELRISFAEI